ncbi:hypothetical protein AB5L52_46360 (plasmid) [Streptomyces sp. CG4]|uniref:hypothetical protein n=1 Tax=unclassified Streptomyces TaxID=2593676 RepID=UPI00332E64D0
MKACRWGRSAARTWAIQRESPSAFPARGVRSSAKSRLRAADLLDFSRGAVDRLVARDRETALELLQRALPGADPTDLRVERLRVIWARALLHQGRAEECARVATQALAQTRDPHLRTQLRWILVRHARTRDRPDAMHAGQAVIGLAEDAAPLLPW